MTQISRLLWQRSALCQRAVEQTRDVNEAYLVVHGVMARALGRVGAVEDDLGAALATALELHSQYIAPHGCAPVSAPTSILQITLNRRIWRITLDGAFYGDYRTQRHATDSANAAAAALRGQGRTVTIIAPQADA